MTLYGRCEVANRRYLRDVNVKRTIRERVGENMKVVHITPYYPPCIGGIARFVSGVVEHIGSSAEVQVISQEGKTSKDVRILPVGKGRFIIKVNNLLRRMAPDVVHCHSHWHMLAPAVIYKRFNKEVKIFFTFHTEPPEEKRGIKSNIFGRLLSNCDAVTFVSEALKETIGSQVEIHSKQEVIYPGVSDGNISEKEGENFAKAHGAVGSSPILVFIGLLEWKKKVEGVRILLGAVDLLRREFPSLMLLVVGDGSRRGELEEVISDLNLSDNVRITGLVDNVLIPLSLGDFYVHISLQEGLPQSLLEAMSLGKPIVASKVGGIPEIVSHLETGILVESEESAIASALEGLLRDPDLSAKLGNNAKGFVESNLSWERIGKEFLELYTSS